MIWEEGDNLFQLHVKLSVFPANDGRQEHGMRIDDHAVVQQCFGVQHLSLLQAHMTMLSEGELSTRYNLPLETLHSLHTRDYPRANRRCEYMRPQLDPLLVYEITHWALDKLGCLMGLRVGSRGPSSRGVPGRDRVHHVSAHQ